MRLFCLPFILASLLTLSARPARAEPAGSTDPPAVREALLRQELDFVRSAVRSERERGARLETDVARLQQEIRTLSVNLSSVTGRAERQERQTRALRIWLWVWIAISVAALGAAGAFLRRRGAPQSAAPAPGIEDALRQQVREAEARLRAMEQDLNRGQESSRPQEITHHAS